MGSINFPNQRIPEGKKDKQWHINHVLGYVSYSTTEEWAFKKNEIRDLIYGYQGILTKKQKNICEAMITQRYGENFGPEYMVYPLIETIIESIIGRYRLRPVIKKALVNNKNAVIKKLDAKIDMLNEQIMRDLNADLEGSLGFVPETENPDMEIPPDIEEHFEKDYRTVSEEITEDILYQLLEVFQEKEKIFDLLRFYLITGRCFAFVEEVNGHPSIFVPHLLDCHYDIDPSKSLQDDLDYFAYDKYMTVNDIFNMFPTLSENQKLMVEGYSKSNESGQPKQNNGRNSKHHWFSQDNEISRIRVVSMTWKSRKRVNLKSFKNKKGNEEMKVMPSDYKKRDRDTIKHIDREDNRFVTMIGPDICLAYGSEEDQLSKVSAPHKRYLTAIGVIDEVSVGTGEIRSVAKKLMQLQNFASEILYELRLSLRQIDGNVLVYDMANIPKQWANLGADDVINKVNFHLKRDRMQIINSKGRKSNPYAGSQNVSQKGRIQEVIGLLAVVEDIAKKITGTTEEELGQAGQYQKATVAEMNMNSGLARSEELLAPFVAFQAKLLERANAKAKLIYKKGDTFHYFGGDNQAKFLKIMPEWMEEDLGIHIADNRKEQIKVNKMEQMAEASFGSPQTPEMYLELLRMYNADSSTEKEAIFKKGIKALAKIQQENNESQGKIEDNKLQAMAAEKDKDRDVTREGHAKDKVIAKIYADNKSNDTATKEDGQNLRKAADIQKDMEVLIANLADKQRESTAK